MTLAKAQPEADPSSGGAKDAKFGEIGKYFSLRSWRLGAIHIVKVVLLRTELTLSIREGGSIDSAPAQDPEDCCEVSKFHKGGTRTPH